MLDDIRAKWKSIFAVWFPCVAALAVTAVLQSHGCSAEALLAAMVLETAGLCQVPGRLGGIADLAGLGGISQGVARDLLISAGVRAGSAARHPGRGQNRGIQPLAARVYLELVAAAIVLQPRVLARPRTRLALLCLATVSRVVGLFAADRSEWFAICIGEKDGSGPGAQHANLSENGTGT